MSYIGNTLPANFQSLPAVQRFNGNASTTAFTLAAAIANDQSILVSVDGVVQDSNAYSVSGTTLTFTAAPSSGTGNIFVNTISPVGSTLVPPDGSVSTVKLVDGSVSTVKLVDGSVTQAKVAGEAINESKLQVSNSPTNGYFLSAQSGNTGGLTWAEASAGKILQVVGTNFASTFTTTSNTFQDVTDFKATLTPASSSNKVLVNLTVSLGSNDWFGCNVVREVSGSSDVILNGGSTSVGSKLLSSFGSLYRVSSESNYSFGLVFLDSPSTTSAVTYQVMVNARGNSGGTVYVNRPHTWNDDAISGRVTASNIVIQEVSA